MNAKKYALALALAAIASSPAFAGHQQGFYLSGGAGANIQHDSDIEGAGVSLDTEYDLGWAGVAALGYGYGNGFRSELELGHRTNGIDSINSANANGDSTSWNVFANVLYDFHTNSRFTPYVGVGAGAVWVNYDNANPVGATRIDDNDTSFGVQGIVGASYAIDHALSVFADYRYLTGFDPEFTADDTTTRESDYDNSTFLVGLRYSFGAPQAPRREPAPAPVAKLEPRSYLVFFDFDKSELTPEAKKVLAAAAEEARKGGVAKIDLTGHADRAGTDKYNQALSKRRVEAVRKELVRLGLKSSEIATFAKGESQPLVPTDDGVREPQNRRVEIVYSVSK